MYNLKRITIIFVMFLHFICYNVFAEVHFEDFNNMSIRNSSSVISSKNVKIKWQEKDSFDYDKDIFYSIYGGEWIKINDKNTEKVLNNMYDGTLNLPMCSMIETDRYIVLTDKHIGFPMGMSGYRTGKIYLLDKNTCDLVKVCERNNAIGLTSYVDDVFYVLEYTSFYSDKKEDIPYDEYRVVTKQKTYCTTDFENWELYSDVGEIPITNGKTTICMENSLIIAKNNMSFYLQRDVDSQQVFTFKNNNSDKEIIYESVDVAQVFPLKDIFVGVPSTHSDSLKGKFLASYDGIYFNTIDLPKKYQNLYMISEGKANDVICSINSYEKRFQGFEYKFCNYDELKRSVSETSLYVQLNNRILGFSTPPVMEEDRMLVPMRFLFEQMGAEVNWDENTQTATATVPVSTDAQLRTLGAETAKSVTFAIDDTTATVNGSTAEMDVPARLVNDKTMVPLRFLSENLGCTVDWDDATNTAIITTNN